MTRWRTDAPMHANSPPALRRGPDPSLNPIPLGVLQPTVTKADIRRRGPGRTVDTSSTRGVSTVNSIIYIVGLVVVVVAVLSFFGLR